MSRAWRIEYEGALYHLLSRGNEGSDIFVDKDDRQSFLNAIEEMSQRFEIDVFAYVLILSQFEGEQDRPKSYRAKVQKYAQQDKHLFEDLRHGLIVGSRKFAEKIREKYLPPKLDAAVPQQSQLATTADLQGFLVKAERKLKCDLKMQENSSGFNSLFKL